MLVLVTGRRMVDLMAADDPSPRAAVDDLSFTSARQMKPCGTQVLATRTQYAFLLLAVFQALHSVEEFVFELWNYLAPARFLSSLISDDLPAGFAIINLAVIALAFWSYCVPVRNGHSNARAVVWFWAIIETLNGIGHLGFGASVGAYFPGMYTAPFLLLIGVYLIFQLMLSQNVT